MSYDLDLDILEVNEAYFNYVRIQGKRSCIMDVAVVEGENEDYFPCLFFFLRNFNQF